MSHPINISEQIFHSLCIIRNNCQTIIKDIVDGHNRNVTQCNLQYLRLCKVNTCDHNSVKSPISGMFQIRHPLSAGASTIDKCKIIISCLCGYLEAIQHRCEIIMGQTIMFCVCKKDSDIITAVCLQRPCKQIRAISHFFCFLTDHLFAFFADVCMIVQCFADCCNGNLTFLCYIF